MSSTACARRIWAAGRAELLHVYERIIDVMRTLQRRDS